MRKRITALTLIIVLMLAGLSGRIGQIIFSKKYVVSDSYNSVAITVDKKYTNIYYRDMSLATNNKNRYIAVIRPNSKSIMEAKQILSKEQYESTLEELSKGYPVAVELDSKPATTLNNIIVHSGYKTQNRCYQLLSPASNGLLKYLSKEIGEMKVSYTVDARGRLLDGDYGRLIDENYNSLEGYRISIDERIQGIALKASENMPNGVVLVMNIADASILACVNRPLDNYNIKAFSRYSVGSVFKIIVSACALENNLDISYNCTGSITVGDTTFSCQGNHIHSKENLKTALANSCNCYFVNLALELGADRLTQTAKKLGFLSETDLCEGWSVKNSVFPSTETLSSKGQLALLGFGQGTFLASPLQIASALCTIGNKGIYIQPQLVLSSVSENGVLKNNASYQQKSVLKESTCQALISYMRYVVTNGTGKNAEDAKNKSAGKTATAQTGQYVYGIEQMNTWFAGVYPYDEPRYAIVVMREHGKSGAEDCCPIFRTIVENI